MPAGFPKDHPDAVILARDGETAAAALVEAWAARRPREVRLGSWSICSTDGWAIFESGDCFVTRLPLADIVAISGRPYKTWRREILRDVEREIAARGFQCVTLVPPRPCFHAEPQDFADAWEFHRDPGLDGYTLLGRDLVDAVLEGRTIRVSHRYLDASVFDDAIYAVGHCLAARAPDRRGVVLVSTKRYRGAPLGNHRFFVSRFVRAALAEGGIAIRDVMPKPAPGREPRASDLLAAWELERPRLTLARG